MKKEEVTIKISKVVGGSLCISSEDGEKIYKQIAKALKVGKKINLSFEGVQDLTSAFLNAAVGSLYNGEFSEKQIRENLRPVDASQEDLFLLKRVVDRAKKFFKDPDSYTKVVEEVIGGDGD